MTWFEASQDHIRRIHNEYMLPGMTVEERAKVLTEHYPFAMRMGSAYKAWLRARKAYLDGFRPTPLETAIADQIAAEQKRRKGKRGW